jgi:hypothetical protein
LHDNINYGSTGPKLKKTKMRSLESVHSGSIISRRRRGRGEGVAGHLGLARSATTGDHRPPDDEALTSCLSFASVYFRHVDLIVGP